MPNMRGLELICELSLFFCGRAKMLVCSGMITPRVAEEYHRLGVHSFIHTPLLISELAQTVIKFLS
jgi:hypothetical protein